MTRYSDRGIDSKALVATLITKIPLLLVLALTGAVIGSGINFVLATNRQKNAEYVSETEYYIEFAPGRYEAKDYYNAYTWNDVMATDEILGRAMETLGGGYDRNEIRSMITAEILSDVRYLTVTIKGSDSGLVYEVKEALGEALSVFAEDKEEFTSISRIEDNEIVLEKIPRFTLRAALLGMTFTLLVGVFLIAFCFCIGSYIYTRLDVSGNFGLSVFGITYRRDTKDCYLEGNFSMLTDKYSEIFLADASDGVDSDLFLKQSGLDKNVEIKKYSFGGDENKPVIIVIPFGKSYREKITDVIENISLRGADVLGAVIVDADDIWYRIYKS
jgi:capsular polysaccharide biosynthesis protein